MKDIESLWFNNPKLNEAEFIALAYPANHTQNSWRAVGGKLFITNQRVLFLPNKIDNSLGGEPVEFYLHDIETVFLKEGQLSLNELFSGGLVDRLGLRMRDGQEHLFVVEKVTTKRGELESHLENK